MKNHDVGKVVPIILWDEDHEIPFNLDWIRLSRQAHTACEPRHVCVDHNTRLNPKRGAQHAIRCLPTHSRQPNQFLHRVWDNASMLLDQFSAASDDVLRLVPVKTG